MRLLRGLENGLQRHDLAEAGVARPGDPGDRIELLGLDVAPSEVRADGRLVRDASYDGASKRLRVPLASENVTEVSFGR